MAETLPSFQNTKTRILSLGGILCLMILLGVGVLWWGLQKTKSCEDERWAKNFESKLQEAVGEYRSFPFFLARQKAEWLDRTFEELKLKKETSQKMCSSIPGEWLFTMTEPLFFSYHRRRHLERKTLAEFELQVSGRLKSEFAHRQVWTQEVVEDVKVLCALEAQKKKVVELIEHLQKKCDSKKMSCQRDLLRLQGIVRQQSEPLQANLVKVQKKWPIFYHLILAHLEQCPGLEAEKI